MRQSRYLSFCASALLGAVTMFIIVAHVHINQPITHCVTGELESVAVEGKAKNRWVPLLKANWVSRSWFSKVIICRLPDLHVIFACILLEMGLSSRIYFCTLVTEMVKSMADFYLWRTHLLSYLKNFQIHSQWNGVGKRDEISLFSLYWSKELWRMWKNQTCWLHQNL